MSLKSILHRVSGRRFKPLKPKTRWQDNPQFSSYIQQQISSDHETGVHGAIRAEIGDTPLRYGVSVGSGTGDNERDLIAAGLVENFDLFEVSRDRISQSKALAAKAGIGNRVKHHLEDALQRDFDGIYDLVYWEHALHHMLDVDYAIAWSVRALKTGGILVVNDYVGPTRLQWRRKEVIWCDSFCAKIWVFSEQTLEGYEKDQPSGASNNFCATHQRLHKVTKLKPRTSVTLVQRLSY